MKKIFALLLSAILLISCFCGCSEEKKADPNAVLQHLLTDIQFDAPLTDTEDMAAVYFPGLPEGSTIRHFISSSGYYPDEVAMITVSDSKDLDAAKAVIQTHVDQVHNQFQSYIPAELPAIENAVIWETGNTVFLVITDDHSAVNKLFQKAHTFSAQPEVSLPTVEPTTQPTTAPVETTAPPTTVPPETEPPTPPVLTSQSGQYGVYSSGVVKVDNAAYEPYGYDPYVSGTYASLVSSTADNLAGEANVYCLPIPTAISVTLPDDIMQIYPRYQDQGVQIEEIFTKMSPNVIGVNCYPNLMLHRDEYLYYRTDYHWNGPGAYYAYESFCNVKGITPYTMEQRQVLEFDNFLGYLYTASSGKDPALGNTPDTVIAYLPYHQDNTMTYVDAQGNEGTCEVIRDATSWASNGKYLCYAAGDQPYAEFYNENVTDGSVLVLVKESYGNVLLSYLVDHYSVVYEIDYRYWKGSVSDFAREVGATDVLFANNMTMISAGVLVGMLSSVTP